MAEGLILEYPNVTGSGEIWLDVVMAICGDTKDKSMVDLMCHHAPYTSQLGFKERRYIDVLDRGLDNKEEEKYFIKMDVFDFLDSCLYRDQFDVMICSDGIEHLTKEQGHELLHGMWLYSNKQIIFTPTGDHNLTKDNNPDTHKSSWNPEDFDAASCVIINFPNFHSSIKLGAFFAFTHNSDLKEYERVKSELNNKSWAK